MTENEKKESVLLFFENEFPEYIKSLFITNPFPDCFSNSHTTEMNE